MVPADLAHVARELPTNDCGISIGRVVVTLAADLAPGKLKKA